MSGGVRISESAGTAGSKATRGELVIETAGAIAAALVIFSLFWSGDEVAPALAHTLSSFRAAVTVIVSFLPSLVNVSLPEWYVALVALAGAATTPQFRIAREVGWFPSATFAISRVKRLFIAGICFILASYSLLGLALLLMQFQILSTALGFFMSPRFERPPDEMGGAINNAMGSFYFVFMTLAFLAVLYVANLFLLPRVN